MPGERRFGVEGFRNIGDPEGCSLYVEGGGFLLGDGHIRALLPLAPGAAVVEEQNSVLPEDTRMEPGLERGQLGQ